jgi:hypothetical protein
MRTSSKSRERPRLAGAELLATSARAKPAVVIRGIDLLKPDPKNARRHTAKQIRQIGDSIASFGFNVPILISADLQVVADHGRLAAARELGFREVPTIMLDHLTEAQARAFMIADNRLGDLSSWDEHVLGQQLKLLSDLNLDFSLELTGFDVGKIEVLTSLRLKCPRRTHYGTTKLREREWAGFRSAFRQENGGEKIGVVIASQLTGSLCVLPDCLQNQRLGGGGSGTRQQHSKKPEI